MIPDPADAGLCAELPLFRRAREYRLYATSGKRFADFWQGDGHAILGHRVPGVSTAVKNLVSRGLLLDIPSTAARRVERLLRELLPSHPFIRIYGDLGRCLAALGRRGGSVAASDLADPAVSEPTGRVGLWRPFLAEVPQAPEGGGAHADVLVPVLPFAICGGPWAVCLREEPGPAMPPSDVVSAVALEGVALGLLGLRRYTAGRLASILARLGSAGWSVNGVYVAPRFERRLYPEVFRTFLRAGYVLSPRYDCPSIIPARLSDGEIAGAVGLFRSNPAQ